LEPFQQSASSNCSIAGDCHVQLSTTTHANTLIRHVSCSIVLGSGGTEIEAYLNGDGSNYNFLPISSATSTGGGGTLDFINTEAYYFVTKGERPRIDVVTSGAGAQVECTFAGYTT
jgi:hypothetical protein